MAQDLEQNGNSMLREGNLEAEGSGASEQPTGRAVPANSGPRAPGEAAREVSAATIGRMMGLATTSELKLLDGKIDLMATRVNNLTARMERILTMLNNMPTGSDMERIDVQLAAIKGLVKEILQGGEPADEGTVAPKR